MSGSSTVEQVLGTLINHHNMRRINSRGMTQANKHVLMATLCYNLKKHLKFTCKLPQIMAIPKGGTIFSKIHLS
ncbi:transposase [uncultured Chryseobacterium sp.]|uniref:transposase n=1 Tax=uncultured Chryseobacterium sp. TaxID=259322 RepID=UPI00261F3521|nr:transposase [uncultured Chryseobacterium sp.]